MFKCRCIGELDYHRSITHFMKGEWDIHISMCNTFYPYGLHRDWYKVLDLDADDLLSDDNLELVKYRKRFIKNKWY